VLSDVALASGIRSALSIATSGAVIFFSVVHESCCAAAELHDPTKTPAPNAIDKQIFSIDVTPTLTYRYAFSPLTDFNGLTFGLGIAGNYRFGEDPDAPKANVRSISFGEVTFPPLYAAMQSYYAKNAFAKMAIRNVEKFPINDVQVSFFQAGYMDTPTKLLTIPTLEAGQTVEVPVVASFNSEVFLTNGDTPLNGQIEVEYTSRNRPAKQSLPVSYTLYDRTSISWDDDRKEAAFITKADTALRNYATFIRQAVKDRVVPGYSEKYFRTLISSANWTTTQVPLASERRPTWGW